MFLCKKEALCDFWPSPVLDYRVKILGPPLRPKLSGPSKWSKIEHLGDSDVLYPQKCGYLGNFKGSVCMSTPRLLRGITRLRFRPEPALGQAEPSPPQEVELGGIFIEWA